MITIRIPGKPRAKQGGHQAVVRSRGGVTRSIRYQPAEVRNYAAFVALCAREAMSGGFPIEGPVRRTLNITIATPKSWTKKKRAEHQWCLVRPDCGNVAKLIDDALEGIVFVDDKQIVEASETKRYGVMDEVEVYVEDLSGPEHAWRQGNQ